MSESRSFGENITVWTDTRGEMPSLFPQGHIISIYSAV